MSEEGAVDFRKAALSEQAQRQDKLVEANEKENQPPLVTACVCV
jgi:hypothetical protein